MNHTEHFQLLKKRSIELKKALLPPKRSPTGNYKNSTYERVSGYKLLFHAELEYYFEELTISIMKHAKEQWAKKQTVSLPLLALMAYCTKEFSRIPENTNDKHAKEDINSRINAAYTIHYKYIVTKNHGIKGKNILALLLPIGFKADDIDNNLLIALDNFGDERGKLAHKTKAKQCVAPEDAEATVNSILTLLDPFDAKLLKDFLS